MSISVSNTLTGEPGTRPSNASLAETGEAGAVTITSPSRAAYDDTHTIYGRPSLRIDTGRHRGDTPQLHIPLPKGEWWARWYLWHPPTQEAGHGASEVRWHAAFGKTGLLTYQTAPGNFYARLQKYDIAADADPAQHTGARHQLGESWLRLELHSDGKRTELRAYEGHATTDVHTMTWGQGLSGPMVLTGYRYLHRKTLYWGDQGKAVRQLQLELQDLGYDLGPAGADGDFGNSTYYAVRGFQRKHKISPDDGIPGPETRAAMDYQLGRRFPPLWVSHLAVSDEGWVGPVPDPAPEPEPRVARFVVGLPI
ncbi:peptidoglycan-binding protein [Nocardiopsis rhodophaea]|uniref:peptidoglycan-binding protein n=1 Tax=Nocardiopsis rhodophaea TaxID=280238 RepID=UPI0031E24C6D